MDSPYPKKPENSTSVCDREYWSPANGHQRSDLAQWMAPKGPSINIWLEMNGKIRTPTPETEWPWARYLSHSFNSLISSTGIIKPSCRPIVKSQWNNSGQMSMLLAGPAHLLCQFPSPRLILWPMWMGRRFGHLPASGLSSGLWAGTIQELVLP